MIYDPNFNPDTLRRISPQQIAAMLLKEYSDEKVKRFFKWRNARPHLYPAFEAEFLRRARMGAERISSKDIFEHLRKEFKDQGEGDFAVDNTWYGFFARIVVFKYPEFRDLIEINHRRAA